MTRLTLVVPLLAMALVGCDPSAPPTGSSAAASTSPPQLWSHHKVLDISPDDCASKARTAVRALGFIDIVTKDDFTYANYGANRAAVKCVAIGAGSFVYFAVAGPDKAVVEKLRNDISRHL